MYRRCAIVFAAFIFAWAVHAQQADSIQLRAATLAARGEVGLLRPLYRAHRAELLPQTRLFCELAIARADGNRGLAVACIDSLIGNHARQLDLNGRLALVELKVSMLLQDGKYAEAKAQCEKELSYFKRRKMGNARLQTLRDDLKKAARFAPNTLRARMLGLAARGQAFELRPLYLSGRDSLDAYARLRCAWELARAFRQGGEASQYADTLLACYADSLDAAELTLCLRAQAGYFVSAGEWKALRAFCDRYEALSQVHGVHLPYYRRMADAFQAHPAATVELPPRGCSLPLSPQWPLFVPVEPNGRKPYPFLLDTGQGYTLLPEAEAKACGLQVLPDTLSVASPTGMLSVSPAYADSLVLGDIVFRHVVVYAVHPGEFADPLYVRVLGCNELLRLPGMVFYPEKLVFPGRPLTLDPSGGELRLSSDGALRLRAGNGGHLHLFSLDTGSSDDVFPAAVFPPATTDTLHFEIAVGDSCYVSPYPVFIESRAADHDGLVGVPFLRQFRRVCFDFGSMRLSLRGYAPGISTALAEAALSGRDLFSLSRNGESLLWTASERDRLFYRLMVRMGQNAPDSVLRLCARIEADGAPDVPERNFLTMARYRALLLKGDEAEAARQLLQAPAAHDEADPSCGTFRSLAAACEAASRFAPMEWKPATGAGPVAPFLEYGGGLCVQAASRRRIVGVDFGLSDYETVVSEQTARRLKIKTCYKDSAVRFGILDSLRIGGVTLHRVRCLIRPGKDGKIVLGLGALLRLGYAAFLPAGVRLGLDATPPAAAACPMRLGGGCVQVEEETPTGYVVRDYTPADLMARARRGVPAWLDFRRMSFCARPAGAGAGGR